MNEIKEILAGVTGDGISDKRLLEIARIWAELGNLLKSAQSEDGVSAQAVAQACRFVVELDSAAATRS